MFGQLQESVGEGVDCDVGLGALGDGLVPGQDVLS